MHTIIIFIYCIAIPSILTCYAHANTHKVLFLSLLKKNICLFVCKLIRIYIIKKVLQRIIAVFIFQKLVHLKKEQK